MDRTPRTHSDTTCAQGKGGHAFNRPPGRSFELPRRPRCALLAFGFLCEERTVQQRFFCVPALHGIATQQHKEPGMHLCISRCASSLGISTKKIPGARGPQQTTHLPQCGEPAASANSRVCRRGRVQRGGSPCDASHQPRQGDIMIENNHGVRGFSPRDTIEVAGSAPTARIYCPRDQ